jgi:hypothetical protein
MSRHRFVGLPQQFRKPTCHAALSNGGSGHTQNLAERGATLAPGSRRLQTVFTATFAIGPANRRSNRPVALRNPG